MNIFKFINFPKEPERKFISEKYFDFSILKNTFKQKEYLNNTAEKIIKWNDEVNGYILNLQIPFYFFASVYNKGVCDFENECKDEKQLLERKVCVYFIEEFLGRLYSYINKIQNSAAEIFGLINSKSLAKIKRTDITRSIINDSGVKQEFNLLENSYNKFLVKYRPLQDLRKDFVHYQSAFNSANKIEDYEEVDLNTNGIGISEVFSKILNILNELKLLKNDYDSLMKEYLKNLI